MGLGAYWKSEELTVELEWNRLMTLSRLKHREEEEETFIPHSDYNGRKFCVTVLKKTFNLVNKSNR